MRLPRRLPQQVLHRAQSRAEMGTVIDPYTPDASFLKAWKSWSLSTLAIVQLRNFVNEFSALEFKAQAADLFTNVGQALARADEKRLATLTTPSCFRQMLASLRARPQGQVHTWSCPDITASIKQARIGYNASDKDVKYAQLTCAIDAKIVWEIRNDAGKLIGSTGSEEAPHALRDFWVMERCLSESASRSGWQLKERLMIEKASAK